MLTIKHKAKSLRTAVGTVRDIKRAIALEVGLLPGEMKLIRKGKVLADPEEVVKAEEKLMLLRQDSVARRPPVRLTVREIISGRTVRHHIPVDPIEKHDDLVRLVTDALRLPPCDEFTEVRLFLPHVGTLMRPDLTLLDYPIPPTNALCIFAVPCPVSAHAALKARADEQAALLQEAEQSLRAALARGVADGELADDDDAHDGVDSRADPPNGLTLASALVDRRGVAAPHARSLRLPLSLVEAEMEAAASADASDDVASEATASELASSVYTVASSSTASVTSAAAAASTVAAAAAAGHPPPPEAYGIPSRLRAGLMPAHDDVRPSQHAAEAEAWLCAEELGGADIDAALARWALAGGGGAAASSVAEYDWDAVAAYEEARLEERCAELVALLDAPLPPTSPRCERPLPSARDADERSVRCASVPPPADEAEAVCGECCESAHAVATPPELCTDVAVAADGIAAPSPVGGKEAKVKGRGCKSCGCRLPLTAYASACRCGHAFCAEHMHAHDCAFDYRGVSRRKLAEDNPKLEGPKLERL